MKKRKKFVIPIAIILLLIFLTVSNWLDRQPDDFISQTIKKQLNNKIYYKKENSDSGNYRFIVKNPDKELLTDIANAANAALEEIHNEQPDKITPIKILLYAEFQRNSHALIATLSNYVEETGQCFPRIISMEISGAYPARQDIYNVASFYTGVKDIKKLYVDESVNRNAVDEGIDWFKVWSDLPQFSLDGINIQKPDDSFSKTIKDGLNNKVYYLGKNDYDTHVNYRFLIMDFGKELITDVTDTVNEILAENGEKHPDRIKVCLCVQMETNGSHHTTVLALLSNFNYDLSAGYSKGNPQLTDIEIIDVTNKSSTHVLNSSDIKDVYYNADSYVNLKGIKTFTVNEALDESARAEGIDWYEVWPDLKNYSVDGSAISPTTTPSASPIPELPDLKNFSTKPGSSSVK